MAIHFSQHEAPDLSQTVVIHEIDDPTAVGETLEVMDQDTMQLEARPLRVRRIAVRLGSCTVLYQSTNRKVRTRTRIHDGDAVFVGFGPQASGTLNGLPIGPDCVVAGVPGVEVECVVAAGYESATLLLPIRDVPEDLLRCHRDDAGRGFRIFQPGEPARSLYAFGRRLVDLASRQPEVFDLPRTRAVAREEAREVLLTTLAGADPVEPRAADRTRQAYCRAVKLAEAYAMAHTSEELHLRDLCEAAGVSERTLQYAFKSLMGIGPVAYLGRLRLHRVRQALRAATVGSTTVTQEALRWGFWHMGDFSRSYKACFGESPSDTLRRTRPEGVELERPPDFVLRQLGLS